MAYITQADLEARLTVQTVLALYDDGQQQVDLTAMTSNIDTACSRIDRSLATEYAGPFPLTANPTPAGVKDAALEWLIAISFERRPEYLRTYWTQALPDLYKRAEEATKKLVEAREYLTDLAQKPANIGGYSAGPIARLISDNADGTSNSGDF